MEAKNPRDSLHVQYDGATWLVTAFGVVLGVVGVAYSITHPEPMMAWAVELALVSAPAAAIVYGGYWIAAHQVSSNDRWNIAKWCIGGTVVAAVLFFVYTSSEQSWGGTVLDPELLVVLGALGGGVISLFAMISNERRHLDVASDTDMDRLVAAGAVPLSADAQAFAELATDTRSWYIIRALGLAEEPLSVEPLAVQIAALEGVNGKDVLVELVHWRFPKLAADGLIEYESDVNVVRPGDRLPTVLQASQELLMAGEDVISIDQ